MTLSSREAKSASGMMKVALVVGLPVPEMLEKHAPIALSLYLAKLAQRPSIFPLPSSLRDLFMVPLLREHRAPFSVRAYLYIIKLCHKPRY